MSHQFVFSGADWHRKLNFYTEPTTHLSLLLSVTKIALWSSRWFEEISVALIWLALIWLALIWLALIWVTQIWIALIWLTLIWLTLIWLTLIWLTLIWLTLIWLGFLSKFFLFSLNIHNLGTHLAHTQMKQISPNGTFTYCFTIISTYKPKELPSIHF